MSNIIEIDEIKSLNSHKNNANKKAKRLNSLSRINSTSASQTNGGAKIQIKSKTAIPRLKNLAEKYKGLSNPYGFLTNLRNALGIPDSAAASKYGVVNIPKKNGASLQVSLRITNHNANADTYIKQNANYTFNLSIVISKRYRKNRFNPNLAFPPCLQVLIRGQMPITVLEKRHHSRLLLVLVLIYSILSHILNMQVEE